MRKAFTLVELLIVIAIIAILAAITIPQFSKYKQRAYVAAMKSDAHNIIAAEEAYFAQYDKYATGDLTNATGGEISFKDPDNDTVTVASVKLTKNVVLLDYDNGSPANQIGNNTCPDGSPGYKFALGHENIKSGGKYKIIVRFDSCSDKAPEEVANK